MAVAKKSTQAKSRPPKSAGIKNELKTGSNPKKLIFPEGGLRGLLNRASKKSSTSEDFYLQFNGLFKVDKAVIQCEIKQGIKRAEGWHRKNTGELKIISLDKSCRPPKVPSHKLKIKINELLKDPEKKQAATAYIASRGALNSFATASVSINASKDGVMSKAALREIFLGFQYLGAADYLCKANYLMDDSLLIKEQGRIQAESKQKSDSARGGKNAHKNSNTELAFVKVCWNDWQKNKSSYKNATKFCDDMLDKCEHLTSHKNLMDHCTAWKKELSKK
jgi:hypothetical protein